MSNGCKVTTTVVRQSRVLSLFFALGIAVMFPFYWDCPILRAEAPSSSKAQAATHRMRHDNNHILPRYYWSSEKLGRIRSLEVEDDVVYISIFEHHGPQPYWLTGAEMRDEVEKIRGYRDAVSTWVGLLRDGIDTQREWALKTLQENVGLSSSEPSDWRRWYDENGDFLVWDEAHGKYAVDQERKSNRLAEAIRGLRFSMRTDKTRYKVGEPIWVTVQLENIYPRSGRMDSRLWVNARLLWDADVKVELRTHEVNDAGYHHHRDMPPAPSLTREDVKLLDGSNAVEKSFELTAAHVEPQLKPGHYSIQATYKNDEPGTVFGLQPTAHSEMLPERGPVWTGYLETLTEFIELTTPDSVGDSKNN